MRCWKIELTPSSVLLGRLGHCDPVQVVLALLSTGDVLPGRLSAEATDKGDLGESARGDGGGGLASQYVTQIKRRRGDVAAEDGVEDGLGR